MEQDTYYVFFKQAMQQDSCLLLRPKLGKCNALKSNNGKYSYYQPTWTKGYTPVARLIYYIVNDKAYIS